jgi:two-component system nitrate/nitrite response regulator NarL
MTTRLVRWSGPAQPESPTSRHVTHPPVPGGQATGSAATLGVNCLNAPAAHQPGRRYFSDRVPEGIASQDGHPASRNATAPCTWHHGRVSIRCLLVDDNAAFLESASVILQREGMTVVGVASNSAEALRQARALRPDVILVDIGLGDESGFDLARLLAQDGQGSGAEVILISARAEADYAELIAESPAAGFLVKPDLSAQAISRILDHTP